MWKGITYTYSVQFFYIYPFFNIYLDNQSLFGDEVSPLLSQYIKEKEQLLFDQNNLTNLFFVPSPKVLLQFPVTRTSRIDFIIMYTLLITNIPGSPTRRSGPEAGTYDWKQCSAI